MGKSTTWDGGRLVIRWGGEDVLDLDLTGSDAQSVRETLDGVSLLTWSEQKKMLLRAINSIQDAKPRPLPSFKPVERKEMPSLPEGLRRARQKA
ncbi:MAG: hypothetical protein ACRDHG_09255 [Anaerolineales bacterium]